MKLSSALLSTAAIFIAASAYAADLPAKKAAPAAASDAVSCPAFGAGYFKIPGSDLCLKVGGYVRSDTRFLANASRPATLPANFGYKYILGFDVSQNSELGTIHSRIGMYDSQLAKIGTVGYQTWPDTPLHTPGGPATESAYVDIGGFRAGFAPSTVDFDNAYNLSGVQYQPVGVALLSYTASFANGSTLTVAAENTTWSDNNVGPSPTSAFNNPASRPDLIVSGSAKLDTTVIKAGVVSHEVAADNGTAQGFAVLGRSDTTMGPAKIILGAAWASGAAAYVDNPTEYGISGTSVGGSSSKGVFGGKIADSLADGTQLSIASMGTAAVEYTLGSNVLYAYVGQQNASQSTHSFSNNIYGVGFKYPVSKTLYIRPELYQTVANSDGTTTITNAAYLRIRKDF